MEQLSFDKFISTINKEAARDLVRSINLFMKNFRARVPDSEADSKAVQDFLASMEVAFAQHPLWAGASRDDLDAAVEGLEKYLMTKLYDRTFAADPLDRERDAAVAARLQALQFVRPEHLEIAFDFAADSSLLLAQKELARINMFKSPRDKLACVLSCCKVVNNLLASKKYGAGADDFTPVLIYVTIRAAPEGLPANLAFIERYRMTSRLVSESQYFFVQMQGAVAFIETLDVHGSLKVDPDELIAHMLAAGALTDADLTMMQSSRLKSSEASQSRESDTAQSQPPATHMTQHQPTSPANLLDVGADPAPLDGFGAWTGQQDQQAPTMVEVVDNFQHRPFANPMWAAGTAPPPPPPPPATSQGVPYTIGQQQQQQQGAGRPPPPPPPPQSSQHHSRNPSYDLFSSLTPPPPPLPYPPQYPSQQYNHQGAPRASGEHFSSFPPAASAGSGSGYQSQPTPMAWPGQQSSWAPQPSGPSASSVSALPASFTAAAAPLAPAPAPPPPPPRVPPPPPVPKSVSDLEAEGARLILAAHKAGSLQARYPLLYAPVDLLSLGQVRQVVACYKELALKYEALSLAVEATQQQYRAEQESHRLQMEQLSQAPSLALPAPSPSQPPTQPSAPLPAAQPSAMQWLPAQPIASSPFIEPPPPAPASERTAASQPPQPAPMPSAAAKSSTAESVLQQSGNTVSGGVLPDLFATPPQSAESGGLAELSQRTAGAAGLISAPEGSKTAASVPSEAAQPGTSNSTLLEDGLPAQRQDQPVVLNSHTSLTQRQSVPDASVGSFDLPGQAGMTPPQPEGVAEPAMDAAGTTKYSQEPPSDFTPGTGAPAASQGDEASHIGDQNGGVEDAGKQEVPLAPVVATAPDVHQTDESVLVDANQSDETSTVAIGAEAAAARTGGSVASAVDTAAEGQQGPAAATPELATPPGSAHSKDLLLTPANASTQGAAAGPATVGQGVPQAAAVAPPPGNGVKRSEVDSLLDDLLGDDDGEDEPVGVSNGVGAIEAKAAGSDDLFSGLNTQT